MPPVFHYYNVQPIGTITATGLCHYVAAAGLNTTRSAIVCPCCYDHQLGKDTVRQPSPVITDLMGQLKIQCNSCKNITTVQQYDHHRKSRCRLYFDSPQLSVHDILEKSPTTPTIPVEKRVAEIKCLIRRLMLKVGS